MVTSKITWLVYLPEYYQLGPMKPIKCCWHGWREEKESETMNMDQHKRKKEKYLVCMLERGRAT